MKQHPNLQAEKHRVRVVGDAWALGTNNGVFSIPSPEGPFMIQVLASTGGGWDHVSASLGNRTPTWKEMCAVKDFFFGPEEVVMQLHPAKSNYINCHPFTLHLWRPQTEEERTKLTQAHGDDSPNVPTSGPIPLPPAMMVGPKARDA